MVIIDPVISITEPITVDRLTNKINVSIILETDTAKKGMTLNNIECENIYTTDLMPLVLAKLEEFKVEEE